ncbi:methyl-accepting chemotaxis protein [Pseudoduganella namucuonensis]|uniref:Methyl-accepting chemotaxis protein n=1 Tax=Pseudoduganella namucuonensis TaxID=1035707 RepID=A0A1I7GQJ7_9BURK|nr:methyl-accepting chemotaxis protein [Pseudoduganella namucuonensis]SFU50724.1 methyl-accepting chemotaxis protein [Pseudoduganella namucuonensis]
MRLPTLKVGARLGLGFTVLLLLLAIITAIGIACMAQIQQRLDQVIHINNAETKLVLEMRSTLSDRLISLRNLALSNEAALGQAEAGRIKEQAKKYAAAQRQLRDMLDSRPDASAEKVALLRKIGEREKAALPLMDKAADLAQSLKVDEAARVLMSDLQPLQVLWRAALGELLDVEEKLSAAAAEDAAAAYAQARLFMLALGGVSLLVGVATALLITRGLLRQLGGEPADAVAIAGQIAAGNLAVVIDLKPHDQASLLHAIRGMRDRLAVIVGEVREGTDHIASASKQIASGNADLSARTERQAGTLEETTASMEELTATVRQNAGHAQEADRLALSASEAAIEGGAVVSRVVERMEAINASSRRIVDIIGVIDGIAFQTNILALNAAVEAARAGEQGRGFAVVASEVRGLAQRSAAAAKEIKTLIADSVRQVESGSALAGDAGSTMDGVVASIQRVSGIMSEITAASSDQSRDIEQVHLAISQMDQATQQNAALVEEAAEAARSLQARAGRLVEVVSVFRLEGGRGAVAPRAADAPARRPRVPVSSGRAHPRERGAGLPLAARGA